MSTKVNEKRHRTVKPFNFMSGEPIRHFNSSSTISFILMTQCGKFVSPKNENFQLYPISISIPDLLIRFSISALLLIRKKRLLNENK